VIFQRELWNLNIVTITSMRLTLRNCFRALAEIAAEHSPAISSVVLNRKGLSFARTSGSFKVLGILLKVFKVFAGCLAYAEKRGYEME